MWLIRYTSCRTSLITGGIIIAFVLSSNTLIDLYVPIKTASIAIMGKRGLQSKYEADIIAWVQTGQELHKEKVMIDDIKVSNNLELIGAQIVFRHGARTPLHLLPSIDEVVYSKEQIEGYASVQWNIKLIGKIGDEIVPIEKLLSAEQANTGARKLLKSESSESVYTGQLTSIGEKQLFELGKRMQTKFIDSNLLPAKYDPKYVYCRSTYMNRTLRSARSFLAGLYSSDDKNNRIRANDPFEIEVHNFAHEDMFPNPFLYPILMMCHSINSLYRSLDDKHELKRARSIFLEHIGPTAYTYGITELHDDIVSRRAHNFPVPNDLLELSKDFDTLAARELIFRGAHIGFDTFTRSTAGPLLYSITENFNSILKNYLENKDNNIKKAYQKLFIYSGHDTTIFPLALALEIFDMKWPPYASYILLEYFISKTDPRETYVTVSYNGEMQLLPNCNNYYCPYSIFLQNVQNRISKPKTPVS